VPEHSNSPAAKYCLEAREAEELFVNPAAFLRQSKGGTDLYHLMLVCLGGAIGAGMRHLTVTAAGRALGTAFPWGTLAVNVAGSFAMGLLVEALARKFSVSNEIRLLLAPGMLGGFTTFSAFSLDVAVLWERGAQSAALAYVLASVAGSILALFVGLWLARSIL
jgi:CrcB protein